MKFGGNSIASPSDLKLVDSIHANGSRNPTEISSSATCTGHVFDNGGRSRSARSTGALTAPIAAAAAGRASTTLRLISSLSLVMNPSFTRPERQPRHRQHDRQRDDGHRAGVAH